MLLLPNHLDSLGPAVRPSWNEANSRQGPQQTQRTCPASGAERTLHQKRPPLQGASFAMPSQPANPSRTRIDPAMSSSPYPWAIAARNICLESAVSGVGTFISAADCNIRPISFSNHFTEKLGSKLRSKMSGAFSATRPDRAALLLMISNINRGGTPAFVLNTKLSLKACSRLPRIMFCESLACSPMPDAPQ